MVKDREAILCRGNLFKSYLLFALPIIATNLLQLLFNLADIAVVGIFASDADVAAVGSNTTLIGLIISLFIGLSIGTNVHLAHLIGERKGERIRYAVGTSVIISVLAGAILAVIGTIFATF